MAPNIIDTIIVVIIVIVIF